MRAPLGVLVVTGLIVPGCHRVFGVEPGAGADADVPVVTIESFDTPPMLALGGMVELTPVVAGPAGVIVPYELAASIGELEGAQGNILLDGAGHARIAATFYGTEPGSAELVLTAGTATATRTIEVDATRLIGISAQPVTFFTTPANRLHGMEVMVPTACSVHRVNLWLGPMPPSMNGKLRVGLYRDDEESLTLAADLGSYQPLTGGLFSIALASPVELAPGVYFIAVAAETSTSLAGYPNMDSVRDFTATVPNLDQLPTALDRSTQDMYSLAFYLEVIE